MQNVLALKATQRNFSTNKGTSMPVPLTEVIYHSHCINKLPVCSVFVGALEI